MGIKVDRRAISGRLKIKSRRGKTCASLPLDAIRRLRDTPIWNWRRGTEMPVMQKRTLCSARAHGYLAIFEKLLDTVDAIPASLIRTAEERYAALGPVRYEEAMIANVQAIGCQTPPEDATGFLRRFDAGLRPCGPVFAAEHAVHQPRR
jgi:hypothetical protein